MKFLIDTQQDTLRERMETSDLILGQLLTPLTGYCNWGGCSVSTMGHTVDFQRRNLSGC